MKNIITVMSAAIALFSLNANAQTGKGFVELGAGSTKANLTAPARTTTDDTSSSFTLLGGYMMNTNWGFEGGYADLGKVSLSTSGSLSGTLFGSPFTSTTGTFSSENKASGYLLGLRGVLPINDKFSVVARGGFLSWTTDLTVSSAGRVTYRGTTTPLGGSTKRSFTGTDNYIGLQASYAINDKLAIGLGYTQYKLSGDIDTTVNNTDVFLKMSF